MCASSCVHVCKRERSVLQHFEQSSESLHMQLPQQITGRDNIHMLYCCVIHACICVHVQCVHTAYRVFECLPKMYNFLSAEDT